MAVITDLAAELIRQILLVLLSCPVHTSRPSIYTFIEALPQYACLVNSLLDEPKNRWFDNPSRSYIPYEIGIAHFAQITDAELARLEVSGTHPADRVATIDRLRIRVSQKHEVRRETLCNTEGKSREESVRDAFVYLGDQNDELNGYNNQFDVLRQMRSNQWVSSPYFDHPYREPYVSWQEAASNTLAKRLQRESDREARRTHAAECKTLALGMI